MKKNWISRRGVPIHVLKKVFLMMKLTFLLTVVLQVSTWATGFSQENKVSLQMKDVSLETIILELREQTGIRFFYSIDKIKAIDHLSVDAKNEELKDYARFKELLIQFREFYGLQEYDLKQIDKYIWQLGKDYFPKNYRK